MTLECSRAAPLVMLACLVMLMFQPVFAQEPGAEAIAADVSPLRIETLEIEPTVAKTGDLIIQTYRVRFPDLVGEGREIIILEDRMAPENLPVHPFEAVSLDITKRQIEDEHVWDFAYGLRLMSPEKALYVLPSFSFYYLVRDLGEDIEDAEVRQVDGGGGLVRYVTTITDVPLLDIRDTIELGSFQSRSAFFRTLAWGVAPLPLLVWFVLLVRHTRRPKVVSEEQQQEADELERIEAQIPIPPSIWEARRSLLKRVRALDDLAPSTNGTSLHDVQRNLVISAREYLQAEIPDLHTGDTPRDIQLYVEGLKDGPRKDALQMLTSRVVSYQHGLERGAPTPIDDPATDARELTESLRQLRPHIRLLNGIKGMFGGR
jgi:hypothetical protein